jgi:hypothetical protein
MGSIDPRTTNSERRTLPSRAISAVLIADGIQVKTHLTNGMDLEHIRVLRNKSDFLPGN